MNKPTKRGILKRINEVEEMLKELTFEVEECYEFGRCAREFFEVGDTVGFNHPRFLPGWKFYKGKVEQVNHKERKLKVYCEYYPKPPAHKQLLSVTVRYEHMYLIKGSDSDQEGDPNFNMYDTEELDLRGDWMSCSRSMSELVLINPSLNFEC